jgi:hypothetical protein
MWRLIVGGVIVSGALGVASVSRATAAPLAQQREVRVPDNLPDGVGEEMRVQPGEVDNVLSDPNVILLDVREPWELELYGTRKGYLNIPLAELEARLDELPRDKTILTA